MDPEFPNFDILLEIAQSDPEQLEQIRQRLAARTIEAAPHSLQHRLRGLQFQINAARVAAKNPMAACIQLSEMMRDSLEELRTALNDPMATKHAATARPSATVIDFPGPREQR